MKTVSITPAEAGWVVRSGEIENEMPFRSGAKAEAAGRRLALAIAAQGEPVELRIYLKTGELAARFLCPANDVSPLRLEPRALEPA